jgi:hypothetical protein
VVLDTCHVPLCFSLKKRMAPMPRLFNAPLMGKGMMFWAHLAFKVVFFLFCSPKRATVPVVEN